MDENRLIREYLSPLVNRDILPLALGDDAAILPGAQSGNYVVTSDIITESVHFPSALSPELVAMKMLRVNLSDIAAMGAVPRYYFICAQLSRICNEDWVKRFAKTLHDEQAHFDICLAGGDTVYHNGPISLAVTMVGEIAPDAALKRSNAKPGQILYTSGTIGDAALGLLTLQGKIKSTAPHLSEHSKGWMSSRFNFSREYENKPALNAGEYLAARYHIPQPRLGLGQMLAQYGIAGAVMDVSDGLLLDTQRLCEASSNAVQVPLGAVITAEAIPLSQAVMQILSSDINLFSAIVSGGDDYELLFTVNPEDEGLLAEIITELNAIRTEYDPTGGILPHEITVSRVGHIVECDNGRKPVTLITQDGEEVIVPMQGYKHNSSRI